MHSLTQVKLKKKKSSKTHQTISPKRWKNQSLKFQVLNSLKVLRCISGIDTRSVINVQHFSQVWPNPALANAIFIYVAVLQLPQLTRSLVTCY